MLQSRDLKSQIRICLQATSNVKGSGVVVVLLK